MASTGRCRHTPEALADAGFVIERLREPTNPDPAKPWRRVPLFLNILLRLSDARR